MLRCNVGQGLALCSRIMSAVPVAIMLAACLTPAPSPAAADTPAPNAAGWQALWENRLATADSLFSAAVKADGRDADAMRGLILALMARGRDDDLVARLRDYTRLLPTGPYDSLLPDLIDQNTGLGSRAFYDVLLRYMQALRETRDMTVVDRRRVTGHAIRYALLAGRPDDGRLLARELNRIENWALLGPFDNTSGCGQGKRHIPNYLIFGQTIRGKFGQPISWFQPKLVGLDRSITPDNYFVRDTYNTAYLRTNFKLPRAGRYLISVSYEGDMEFTLNSTVVHEGSRRLGGDESLHWLVELPAGPNRLAFKLSNREEGSRLACGVSLPDGSAVPGIEFMPLENAMPDSSASAPPEPVGSATRTEIARRAVANPGDAEAAFWNLHRAAGDDDPDTVRVLAEQLGARFGSSVLMKLATAHALKRIGERDAAAQQMQAAARIDSTFVPARMAVAAEDLERKRPDEALRAAAAVLRHAHSCRLALAIKLQALTDRQDLEAVHDMGDGLQFALGDDPLPWQCLMTYAISRGQTADVKRYRDEYLKRMPPGSREVQRVQDSWAREDLAAARGSLEKLIENFPDQSWIWSLYVSALINAESFDAAKNRLDSALESFPQSVALLDLKSRLEEAGFYEDTADIVPGSDYTQLRQMFKSRCKQSAAKTLQKAIACDPANAAIRDRIRTLKDLPSYRTYLPDPKPDSLAARRVDPTRYPGEDGVVLLEQHRRFIFDAQADLSDVVFAVQLLTAAGVEQWETYDFNEGSYTSDVVVLFARTVKPDGSIKEARRMPGGVVFADAAPGDVLLLHYQVTTLSTGALSGHIWGQHVFAFPANPCRESSYTLVRPADRTVTSKLWNAGAATGGAGSATTLSDGFVREEWRFTDLPKYGDELLSASALSFVPWLDVSTIPDWSTVARWYADLADGQAEPTPAIRRKAAELVAGSGDDDEVMRRLLRFVSNEITYQSLPFFQSAHVPRQADDVLKDRFGDCKDKCCLLIALARAAGITNCQFALTTPSAPPGVSFLPSPRFNHVVVARYGDAGAIAWYDPTVRHADPAWLPLPLLGVVALPTGPQTADLVTIAPAAEAAPSHATTSIAIDARGDAKLSLRNVRTGGDALAVMRGRLESVTDAKFAEQIAQLLAIEFPGASVSSASATGRADGDSALVTTYEASLPAFAESDGDLVSVRLLWTTSLSDLVGAVVGKAERRTPIDLRSLNLAETDEVQVRLAGVTTSPLPPTDVSLSWQGCSYRTSFTSAPGRLTARRHLVISGLIVRGDDYAGFKEFLEGVRRDMRRTYHLRLR